MSAPYFDLIREMKNAYNHRLRLVARARQHGIKTTARLFQTTVPTVCKWLRRYREQGSSGLIEHDNKIAFYSKTAQGDAGPVRFIQAGAADRNALLRFYVPQIF